MEQQKLKRLTREDLQYIAGFIDGDGSIMAQLVRGDYKYGYTTRVTVALYQKTKRHWFLKQMKAVLGGNLYKKTNGMSVLEITGYTPVKTLLLALHPFLRIKKPQARRVLKIIEAYKNRETEACFLKVCQQVDKVANLNDSKARKHTYASVARYLNCPVETERGGYLIYYTKSPFR